MRAWTVWLLGVAFVMSATAVQGAPNLRVRVVDEAGTPLEGAQVGVMLLDGRRLTRYVVSEPVWQVVDSQGWIEPKWHSEHATAVSELLTGERGGALFVWAWKPGYVAKEVYWEYSAPYEFTITLRRGRTIEVYFRRDNHLPLPNDFGQMLKLAPQPTVDCFSFVYTSYLPVADVMLVSTDLVHDRQILRQPSLKTIERLGTSGLFAGFGMERITPEHWRFTVPENVKTPLFVQVDREGFLRGYLSALTPEEVLQGKAERVLPKAGILVLRYDIRSFADAARSRIVQLARILKHPQGDYYYLGALMASAPSRYEWTLPDAAPGDGWMLSVQLFQGQRLLYRGQSPPARLEPDTVRTLTLRTSTFDPKRHQGTRTVSIQIRRSDGSPLANQPFALILNDRHASQDYVVAKGRLDSQGRATVHSLHENVPEWKGYADLAPIEYTIVLTQSPNPEMDYEARRFRFTLFGGDGIERLEFVVAPKVGEVVPDIPLVDVDTGAKVSLKSFRGKWVVLEFWATWCVPCHSALEDLKRTLAQRQAEWGERVVVLTVSIDNTRESIKPFLSQRGLWEMARHLWAGEGGWNSQVAQSFGIRSIPNFVVIDPEGRLAAEKEFRRTLEEVIEEFLMRTK